jgi:sugar fermentation stimulation protein A
LTGSVLNLFGRSSAIHEAVFLERPNRFVVRAELHGKIVDAHCPNPGRLLEILVPGNPLLLEQRLVDEVSPRLQYALVAARHRGVLVPLRSAQANDLAERIILPRLFPNLGTLQREVTLDKSRLDFLLSFDGGSFSPGGGQELFLEVKGCTLIEEQTAMFPDAPTLRGLKHLGELESLAAQGRPAGILFILMNPKVRRFVPNLHTDPAFTRKLISLNGKIWMRAVSIRTRESGSAEIANLAIPIELKAASAALEDSGAYILVLRLKQRCRIMSGSLGVILFEPGWYAYVGSGMGNLSSRIARHHRRRKTLHWHIDYLRDRVDSREIVSLPVRSLQRLECPLARDLVELAVGSTPRFGCSDCSCSSHLFRFESDPLQDRRFLDLLFHYRHTVALA